MALSNPKTLLCFGAFFPQFMDASHDFTLQVLIMGTTAMALAAISDSAYALLASRAGAVLSRRRVQLMTRASGGLLIGGELWLAGAVALEVRRFVLSGVGLLRVRVSRAGNGLSTVDVPQKADECPDRLARRKSANEKTLVVFPSKVQSTGGFCETTSAGHVLRQLSCPCDGLRSFGFVQGPTAPVSGRPGPT
jgi:hypothetical protein